MASFSSVQWAVRRSISSDRSATSGCRSTSSRSVLADRSPSDSAACSISNWRRLRVEGVDLLGHRIDLDAQSAGGLVDQVDGLVREVAAGDVAVGQHGCGQQRSIGDAHAVVHFVALLEAAQDADGVIHRRRLHQDGLESALQGGVLLDVGAELVQGGGPDHPQFAPGEHRLEHVGGVHGTLGRSGAHDGVHLVDERDDLALGALDLVEHRLEALLELSAVLGPGHHGPQVEGDDALVLEAFGYVAVDDPCRRGLPRWPSCRLRARRSGPGCSWSGGSAPGSPGGSRRRGR